MEIRPEKNFMGMYVCQLGACLKWTLLVQHKLQMKATDEKPTTKTEASVRAWKKKYHTRPSAQDHTVFHHY